MSRLWEGLYYYKVGKVCSKERVKDRLVTYNCGRISGFDDFYMLYLFPLSHEDDPLLIEQQVKYHFKKYQVSTS